MPLIIKPGVTAAGFRTAVKDYTEYAVVEELAANSYDADAECVIVLLDHNKNQSATASQFPCIRGKT
jgi:hypothetical protein